jgi:hypothetical protein
LNIFCYASPNPTDFIGTKVSAWWEWLLATITDIDPAEGIAVKNRSHNIDKPLLGSRKVIPSIKGAAFN